MRPIGGMDDRGAIQLTAPQLRNSPTFPKGLTLPFTCCTSLHPFQKSIKDSRPDLGGVVQGDGQQHTLHNYLVGSPRRALPRVRLGKARGAYLADGPYPR
eukprot:1153263-Pelagomonas_calceolata.AAC.6